MFAPRDATALARLPYPCAGFVGRNGSSPCRFFSADVDRLACADCEGNVAIWRLSIDEELGIRADQELFLTLGAMAGAAPLWGPAQHACMQRAQGSQGHTAGPLLHGAQSSSTPAMHSALRRLVCWRCAGDGQDVHLSWHPLSQNLLAVTARDGLLLIDLEEALSGGQNRLRCSADALPHGVTPMHMGESAQPSAVAFSPDGALLAAGGSACQVPVPALLQPPPMPALEPCRTSHLHVRCTARQELRFQGSPTTTEF